MTGVRLGSVLMNVANMGTAIVISFIYSWKLTLLIIAFMPFIVLGGLMQIRLLTGQAGQNKEALEGAGKVSRALVTWATDLLHRDSQATPFAGLRNVKVY